MDNIETAADTGATFDASAAMESLLAEPTQTEDAQQEQTEEVSPEQAQRNALSEGLNTLYEDGWTNEELLEFSQDATVREDIQKNGKTVRQAARAYLRRQSAAQKTEEKSGKRGVPTMRSASNTGAGGRDQIAEMSDKEFDKFYRQVMSDSLAGKKHRL